MTRRRIGVVYLTDGRRDDLTYASAVALGFNHAREIDIHVVQSGFRADPPSSVLRFLQSRGHRLATHYLPSAERGLPVHGHITATAYDKADAIAAVSDAHDTVCYLDNDTLAMRHLDLAAAAPFKCPLAAVPDLSISTGLDNHAFFENCDKHGLERRYFNSGFISVHVARWNESGIPRRYASAVRAHAEFCPYWDGSCIDLDQCAFNIASEGAWETLPIEFNVQRSAYQTTYWDTALIRHYAGPVKFLPAQAHRTDRQERIILRHIAKLCPDLGVRSPPGFLGVAYLANRSRRRVARSRISQLIDNYLVT